MNDLKKLLQVNDYQNKLYIPNDIFNDLKVLHCKGSSHVAFAYSYYYLISWLYRYAKYGEMDIDVKLIKEVLGYSADNKKVNYIIRKNGTMDELEYTLTDTDYPVAWSFNDGDIEFTLLSDMESEIRLMLQKNKGKNYKVKVPVKGLWRDQDSHIDNVMNGTFYEIDYTHEMLFDVFVKCMENKELGCSGFYLYGYLKYRCFKDSEYNSSLDRIADETGMSRSTVNKYLGALTKYELIGYKENECRVIDGKFKKQANSYSIA